MLELSLCSCSFRSEGRDSSLYIYAVPISASVTRLIINAVASKDSLGKAGGFITFIQRHFTDYFR